MFMYYFELGVAPSDSIWPWVVSVYERKNLLIALLACLQMVLTSIAKISEKCFLSLVAELLLVFSSSLFVLVRQLSRNTCLCLWHN